ncbi:MAG: DNA-directed RNA polymerase subunit alpha [Chloroflexi bacterium]|nr:DNA-directed RNA polymerase subunit alpha [Chloroflexota bacterium]
MAEPRLEIKESDQRYARVVVEALERGSGTTLGNSLRRVLLSSLPGAAVTWMRIDGLQHEFTTIPHVKEDATEFLLNVKSIRLRSLSQRPGTLVLEAQGDKEATAGDIKPSADFEVVNPELHLATLDSADAMLSVEFNIEIGKGYVPADSGRGLPIGTIPVDAIFTPIRRANYSVEPIIVGQESNLERLTLEVWTDGTISGVEAISQAADIMTRQLAMFRELATVSAREGQKTSLRMSILPEKYDMSLEQLGLSTRTLNCLRRGGMSTVGDLLERSQDGLPMLPNFGEKSREEVLRALEELGINIPRHEAPESGAPEVDTEEPTTRTAEAQGSTERYETQHSES